jgi:hypothetical protein
MNMLIVGGAAQLACELVYRCRDVSESKTLWLIHRSRQEGGAKLWREIVDKRHPRQYPAAVQTQF